MGTFNYGSPGTIVEFGDRALTHLSIVIFSKLRRRESFMFSWSNDVEEGSGRSSIIWALRAVADAGRRRAPSGADGGHHLPGPRTRIRLRPAEAPAQSSGTE